MDTLKTQSSQDLSLLNKARRQAGFSGRNFSVSGPLGADKYLGSTVSDFNVKPKLLESKVSAR